MLHLRGCVRSCFIIFYIKISEISMFTIGLITNLMICEKKIISYVGRFQKKLRFY